MPPAPVSAAEFEDAIFTIDNELRDRKIPLHARSLHAIMTYAKRFDMDIPIPPASTPVAPGIYTGEHVGAHILHWYEERYGDRQYLYMGPGSTILQLRNEPWEIRLPLILGVVNSVVERDLTKYANSPTVTTNGIHPTINILASVRELPKGLAKALTDEECAMIVERFWTGMECMEAINSIRHLPYIEEALSDIASAVRHVFSETSHLGQSKWSSAQAAEKLIKSFLKKNGISFPNTHDIEKLYTLASPAGIKHIDKKLINTLQTRAGVRYGEEAVNVLAAVEAHWASLTLGRVVVESFAHEKKIIADWVKGVNLAADRRGTMIVAKFHLGNQIKTFWIPSNTARYILSKASVINADYSKIVVPPLQAEDWDGSITPMWTSVAVNEFDDAVAVTVSLNRGVTDGLAFHKNVWSFFIKSLLQYETMLAP